MQLIETKNAPPARGHYSQAVVSPPFIFVSGLLPIIPGTDRQMPEGAKAQAEQVLKNLQAILETAGSHLQNLVQVQIFMSDLSHWEEVNAVYVHYLGEHKPARGIIPCGAFHGPALLEIMAIAQISG